jgi:DNA (cytosine-5)-methyltransferase 1
MWKEMARIIGEIRPRYAFIENSPMLTTRGLERVLADLAKMGFDAEWGVLGAADIGAPHQRNRIWIYATHPSSERWNQRIGDWKERYFLHNFNGNAKKIEPKRRGWKCRFGEAGANVADSTSIRSQRQRQHEQPIRATQSRNWETNIFEPIGSSNFWTIEPNVGRVANGVAGRVDRLKAIGNGQVPLCAATAWEILSQHE